MLTKKDIEEILAMREEGFTEKHLAKKFGVSRRTIENIGRRSRIDTDTYNEDHIHDKYELNREVFDIVKPKTILDPFCGVKQFWKNEYGKISTIIDNDLNTSINCDLHKDAKDLVNALLLVGASFDLVDMDPFKSSWEYIEPGIQLAKKSFIITDCSVKSSFRFSERNDLLRKRYGIDKDLEYNGFRDYVIPHIISLAKDRFNKELELYYHLPWQTGDRAWFLITNEEI